MFHVCMLSPQIVTPMREAHARQREQDARAWGLPRAIRDVPHHACIVDMR